MKFETVEHVVSFKDEATEFLEFVKNNPDVWVRLPDGWSATYNQIGALLLERRVNGTCSSEYVDYYRYALVLETDSVGVRWVKFNEGALVRRWLRAEKKWKREKVSPGVAELAEVERKCWWKFGVGKGL